MSDRLAETYSLVSLLPIGNDEAAELRRRAINLDEECGCDWSAIYFLAALIGGIVYLLGPGRLNAIDVTIAVVLTLIAAIVGKASGIGLARLRLIALNRSLRGRLATIRT